MAICLRKKHQWPVLYMFHNSNSKVHFSLQRTLQSQFILLATARLARMIVYSTCHIINIVNYDCKTFLVQKWQAVVALALTPWTLYFCRNHQGTKASTTHFLNADGYLRFEWQLRC
jgi:hypothetical protein